MREVSEAHAVCPGRGVACDIVRRDPARKLDVDIATRGAETPHERLRRAGWNIVEQQMTRPGGDRPSRVSKGSNLHFDGPSREPASQSADGLSERHESEMRTLDQKATREVASVRLSTPVDHCLLLKVPQPGRRLSGGENVYPWVNSMRGLDGAASGCSDTAQVHEQVECRPFGSEDAPSVSGDGQDDLARTHGSSVALPLLDPETNGPKKRGHGPSPREDPALLRHQLGA
jgi:hypothetical protein